MHEKLAYGAKCRNPLTMAAGRTVLFLFRRKRKEYGRGNAGAIFFTVLLLESMMEHFA
jgi:hypothetical protein